MTSGVKYIPNNCDNLNGVNGSTNDAENTSFISDHDDSLDCQNQLSRKRKYSIECMYNFVYYTFVDGFIYIVIFDY